MMPAEQEPAMRKNMKIAVSAAAIVVALTVYSGANAKDLQTLAWVDGGGAYGEAVKKDILGPWQAATADKIVQVSGTDNAKLRAMVEAKRVVWDVYNGDNTWGTDLDSKWLVPLDYSVIPKDEILPGFATKYRVANMIYSIQLAYNTDKVKQAPSGWADFFDLQKFPGKRGVMDYSAGGIFEIALLADGVSPDHLYPLDIDRAIRKLNTIKSSLVFWQSGAQSEDLVGSGEVSMVMTYNARAFDVKNVQKKPVDYVFGGQILAAAYLTVPKGSEHVDEAMKLISYAVSKDVNGKLSAALPVAPSNKDATPDPVMKQALATSHFDEPHATFDDQWIAEHSSDLESRYQAWKSSAS
jgi:putative spermidine/putrescine transport system substrate-binding protein